MAIDTVGFIGLGHMGQGMASNILGKGRQLVVLSYRNRVVVDRLVEAGATEAASPADMAAKVDAIVLCVTGSPEVESIVGGPEGILQGARPGLIVIDATTANPVSTVRVASQLAARGVRFADAPMGGTPANAQAGTIQALVGADDDLFAEIEPLIETWASAIVHVGPVGSGHRMKLINNLVSLGYASIYAETLALAQAVGIPLETYHQVIGGGRMRCGFYDTYMNWVVDRNPNAHPFTVANAWKDLRYAESMAEDAGVELPMGRVAESRFGAFAEAGGEQRFVPMLADFVAGRQLPGD